ELAGRVGIGGVVVEAAQAQRERTGAPRPLVHVPAQPGPLQGRAITRRHTEDRAAFHDLARPEAAAGENAPAVPPGPSRTLALPVRRLRRASSRHTDGPSPSSRRP